MVAYKYTCFMSVKTLFCALTMLLNGFLTTKAQVVELVTEQGIMKLKLYNDTPLHTANFLKNVNNGKYNIILVIFQG